MISPICCKVNSFWGSGSHLQTVGGWHTDKGRNLVGNVPADGGSPNLMGLGPFKFKYGHNFRAHGQYPGTSECAFDASLVWGEHTGIEFAPRAYGTLGCVCVGPTHTQPSVP